VGTESRYLKPSVPGRPYVNKLIQPIRCWEYAELGVDKSTASVNYDGESTILVKCGFLALNRRWVMVCEGGGN
jgi:hypothetical protein